jgi:hypothetical protein
MARVNDDEREGSADDRFPHCSYVDGATPELCGQPLTLDSAAPARHELDFAPLSAEGAGEERRELWKRPLDGRARGQHCEAHQA